MIPAIFVWTGLSIWAVSTIVRLKAENTRLKAENETLKSRTSR